MNKSKRQSAIRMALALMSLCWVTMAEAQDSLSLDLCYSLARENYPLIKEQDLIRQTSAFTISNIQMGYLPQIAVVAQASYQSAVTEFPFKIPGVTVPTLSKDQYKLYADVNQVLYDGGSIKGQQLVQQTASEVQQHRIESELYQLRQRINQLYFGILLVNEALIQNDFLQKDISLGLGRVKAAIDNGVALRSNGDVLEADLLKSRQRSIELRTERNGYLAVLGLFIGKNLTEQTILITPTPVAATNEINRPELATYTALEKNLGAQRQLLSAKTQPRLALFLQGGAGRPALNFLSNSFDAFYIGGIRFTWSPSSLYNIKKERQLLDISQVDNNVQRQTFLFNTNLQAQQQRLSVSRYSELLASDDTIITLRTRVKNAALAQLENGVISSNDYLREVNAEDEARQNKIVHCIQLLNEEYSLQTTTGYQP